MSDTGYLIRRLGTSRYEISSWGWDNRPKGVYQINQRSKNRFNCDCPARGVKQCRHIPMVKFFIKNELTWNPYRMITQNETKI